MSDKHSSPSVLSPKGVQNLRDMKKDWTRWRKLEGPEGGNGLHPLEFKGALLAKVSSLAGIPAAEDSKQTGRGKAKLRRLWFRGGDVSSSDMDIVDPDEEPTLYANIDDEFMEIDVYNVNTIKSYGYDEYIVVFPLSGGRFIVGDSAGGGSDIVNGIVHRVLGCGYYEIELAEWSGTTPENDLRYATGTGTADLCDPCHLFLTPVGTAFSDCTSNPTLEEPVSQLTGLGVYVLAYDPQSYYIPLKVNTDCKVVDIGDENAAPNEVGTGTGTGTAVATEPVFHVVRGLQLHEIVFDKEFECCPITGEWKLIRRTPLIIPAKKCATEECYECPTV